MNELLESIAPARMAGYMLVLARIGPLFVLAPLFSSKLLPRRARAIAAVALTIGIAPLAMAGARVPLDVFALTGLMVKEILVGLAFAFAIGALFHAVAAAGSFLDTLIGFSFGALVDPLTGAQSSVLSQLYGLVAVMIFIAIGGDAWVVRGMAETYELVPLLDSPAMGTLTEGVVRAFTSIFTAALAVCAPVLLALVVTDCAVGVVSRVVPQLNVFAVGFPAKVAVGFLVIGASLHFADDWLVGELQGSVGEALRLLRVG